MDRAGSTAATPRQPVLHGAAPRAEMLALAGGRRVIVRPIASNDTRGLQAFVERLSARSRLQRFHLALNALSDAMAQQLTAVDQQGHVALVAEAVGPHGATELVGEARYVVSENGRRAEFGIAVADDWNGRGLGRALMLKLLLRAREQGLERLVGDVLVHNRRMQVLVQGLGGRIRSHPEEESLVIAEFALRP